MSTLAPVHSISVDLDHAEVHFAVGGFWTTDAMGDFLADLAKAATPFLKSQEPFSALGDLREFVPQNRDTAAAIRDSLLTAQKNGLTSFAVVSAAPLVKLQYQRITDGVEVEFFDTPDAAEQWLRRPR
ncbi:STAS/SEC14 domain-containing protein [Erythrobacter rubeus]|uniref:STAS/SEC14 domain-containing protein n=1 Tax=Erythrobacter rubeus TaxID=2760803 RepID=A0ABR8KPU6_9SPHN|nr:STAS/SEC14 domain-containing protein [Erythrobacter rubeus]MBD2841387.1 hypothetical protein [Erythrobacter rubeus]